MTAETLTMTQRERDRLVIIRQVKDKRLSQVDAARQLALTTRQVRNLLVRYRRLGDAGLISGHRQTAGNHRIEASIKQQVEALIREHYADFGPTLASEQLYEQHQIRLSKETLRQWMIAWQLHHPKHQKAPKRHPSRERRAQRGELVQLDGSPHAWFEERAEPCCLIALIDDATSEWISGWFIPTETTQGYFNAIRQHLKQDGRCIAYYSDKHSIFRDNHRVTPTSTAQETQLQRALRQLDIPLICAHTPQAKGRIERLFHTLQDRLVKALRLAGISDMQTANAFLPRYIAEHNQRFAVVPQSPVDAHRPLTMTHDQLEQILCHQHTRKLTKNLELSYQNRLYSILTPTTGYRLRYANVTICDNHFTGQLTLLLHGKALPYRVQDRPNKQTPVVNEKTLNHFINRLCKRDRRTVGRRPAANHPWRFLHLGKRQTSTAR